jgi:hypothetical protein
MGKGSFSRAGVAESSGRDDGTGRVRGAGGRQARQKERVVLEKAQQYWIWMGASQRLMESVSPRRGGWCAADWLRGTRSWRQASFGTSHPLVPNARMGSWTRLVVPQNAGWHNLDMFETGGRGDRRLLFSRERLWCSARPSRCCHASTAPYGSVVAAGFGADTKGLGRRGTGASVSGPGGLEQRLQLAVRNCSCVRVWRSRPVRSCRRAPCPGPVGVLQTVARERLRALFLADARRAIRGREAYWSGGQREQGGQRLGAAYMYCTVQVRMQRSFIG